MNAEKKIACDGGVGRRAKSIHFRIDPAQLKSREHKERICIREFELDVDK